MTEPERPSPDGPRRPADDQIEGVAEDTEAHGDQPPRPTEGVEPGLQGTVDEGSAEPAGVAPTVDFQAPGRAEGERRGARGAKPLPAVPGYEILGELGRGAMGVVYRARQKGLKREVALKMVLAGDYAGPAQLARFQTEAEAVARLQHPNIVQVHEVSQCAGVPFFSMEFVDGPSLDRKLAGKPVEPAAAARLMETLSRAMHHAHRRGVVHRDLKPANVLLTADGTPKISDFGLAKRLEEESSQTKTGTIMGTPSYMAPEQASGASRDVGPLADVYALGAILYELLTGRPPFVAANPVDTVLQVLHEEPVPPRRLQSKVPPDLEAICLKCLQKEARKRYRTAEELAEDFRRFSAGEPILARPVSNWERFWRWCRRNPRVASLSGVAASLALAIVIGSPIAVVKISQEKNAALKAEDDAVAARNLANQRADEAIQQRGLALNAYETFVDVVRRELAGRPAMQDLKRSLLATALEKLEEVAEGASNVRLTDKATAKAHQEMGRLGEDLGRLADALTHYQKSYEIIRVLAAEHPDDSIESKRNPAGTSNKLADVYRRLGMLADARRHYQTALDLREAWVTSDPENVDAKLAVANSYGLLGNVSLTLGDPARARQELLESLKWRRKIPDEMNRSGNMQRQWASLYDGLGDVSCRLGDRTEAEGYYTKSQEIRLRLADRFRKSVLPQQDLVISYLNLGDLRLQLFDDPGAARDSYRQALKLIETLRASDPQSVFPQRALSLVGYRMGATCLRLGEAEEAMGYFQECFEQRQALARESPEDVGARIGLMLVSARCGRQEEAGRMADELRKQFPASPWVLYHVGCCYALCGAAATDGNVDGQESGGPQGSRQRYAASAVEVLRQAIEHGWRDPVLLECDPDLDPIRSHPDYAALLAEARAATQESP